MLSVFWATQSRPPPHPPQPLRQAPVTHSCFTRPSPPAHHGSVSSLHSSCHSLFISVFHLFVSLLSVPRSDLSLCTVSAPLFSLLLYSISPSFFSLLISFTLFLTGFQSIHKRVTTKCSVSPVKLVLRALKHISVSDLYTARLMETDGSAF